MKNLIVAISFLTVLFSCSAKQSYDIFIPGSEHADIIEQIKMKPEAERNYGDFLQLAVTYAETNEPVSVIAFWLDKSFAANNDRACEAIQSIQQDLSCWKLVSEYSSVVEALLTEHGCTNFTSIITEKEIIDYYPVQREGVTDEQYRKWINSLKQTYEYAKKRDTIYTHVDYFNFFGSFMALLEPKSIVHLH